MTFAACSTFEEAWQLLHQLLKPFDIRSIFYGVSYSHHFAAKYGLLRSCIYRTSHHADFQHALRIAIEKPHSSDIRYRYILDNDPVVMESLFDTPMLAFWHHIDLEKFSPEELELQQMMEKWGLTIGVNYINFEGPLFYGFGLCGGRSGTLFDLMWPNQQAEILALCDEFNRETQQRWLGEMVGLTTRQYHIFETYLMAGNASEAAKLLNCSARNVLNTMNVVRIKLNALSTEEAAIKAYAFGLIEK